MELKINKHNEYNSDWQLPVFDVCIFKPKSKKYCFVTIIYNEGLNFQNQLVEMKKYTDLVDIIVADGNSTDGSTDHVFLAKNGVRSLLVTKEKGLSTATRMALGYCLEEGYEGIVTVDGNGKDDVNSLPDFIHELEKGFDLVQGSRFIKSGFHKNTPLYRLFGIKFIFTPLLYLACKFRYTDPTNAFRALSRKFLLDSRVRPFRKEFVRFSLQQYLVYIAGKLSFRIIEIPVSRSYPEFGKIPTKINSAGVLVFIYEMFKVVFGLYNKK